MPCLTKKSAPIRHSAGFKTDSRPCLKISRMLSGERFFTQRACDIRKAAEPPTAIQSPVKANFRMRAANWQETLTQSGRIISVVWAFCLFSYKAYKTHKNSVNFCGFYACRAYQKVYIAPSRPAIWKKGITASSRRMNSSPKDPGPQLLAMAEDAFCR